MSLFDGTIIAIDAMVIINLANLRLLNSFISWAEKELAITITVLREANRYKEGTINLFNYINQGKIIKEPLESAREIALFGHYFTRAIFGRRIDAGEAECLAVAITKNYGLASDEREVRREFHRIKPNSPCHTTRTIIEMAGHKSYLTK